MKCRDIRSDLQELADGSLSDERAAAVSGHLITCPLCREELSLIKELRNDLRSMPRPEFNPNVLSRLRSAVASELSPAYGYPTFRLIEGKTDWWQKWFMPTAVGTFASLVFGIMLLGVILIPADVPTDLAFDTAERIRTSDPLFLANLDTSLGDQFITPQQFAHSRGDVAPESPSINPAGTLAQITNAGSRQTNRDEEFVVVADIYKDGDARIAKVVEYSRDKKMMERLQAAFRPDRFAPPFVPASLDNRGDVVRVILKFQNVNVNIDADESTR
jgi:hypothetical protein